MTKNRKFDYNDRVKVICASSNLSRLGALAWIVAVLETRAGPFYDAFPPGQMYVIEYEDGSSHTVHENDLEFWID
jgi:hypothetical protein